MATIYNLGEDPLLPNKEIDEDVARILGVCSLTPATLIAAYCVERCQVRSQICY